MDWGMLLITFELTLNVI